MTFTQITLETAKAQMDRYPKAVQWCTRLQQDAGMGWSEGVTVNIRWAQATFEHEMGHACANILRIEKELGALAMAQPGAQAQTNENIFCYGAQRLARGEYETALAEYAADAIAWYYRDRERGTSELPAPVAAYLATKLA